jgi:hypothetical protein
VAQVEKKSEQLKISKEGSFLCSGTREQAGTGIFPFFYKIFILFYFKIKIKIKINKISTKKCLCRSFQLCQSTGMTLLLIFSVVPTSFLVVHLCQLFLKRFI